MKVRGLTDLHGFGLLAQAIEGRQGFLKADARIRTIVQITGASECYGVMVLSRRPGARVTGTARGMTDAGNAVWTLRRRMSRPLVLPGAK